MQGKLAVIHVGQKVIKLLRQKFFLKYGAGNCVENHARKTTEWQDLERGYDARLQIQKYRIFKKAFQKEFGQDEKQMNWRIHFKTLAEMQAGNCGQMSLMAYKILEQMVPPGLVVERRAKINFKDNQDHLFVLIRPLDTTDKKETLIIDPWPSNQLNNPEVVSYADYFQADSEVRTLQEYRDRSVEYDKKLVDFSGVQLSDFDMSVLEEAESIIEKKERYEHPLWEAIRRGRLPWDIFECMTNHEYTWNLFRYRRRDVRSVRKDQFRVYKQHPHPDELGIKPNPEQQLLMKPKAEP